MEETESTPPHPDIPAGPDLSNEAGWPPALTDRHRLYLHDRGVSAAVAYGRGYRSVTARVGSGGNNLSDYGWGKNNEIKNQINAKNGDGALVIPLFDATRAIPSTHQARLDNPRINTKGKPIKFEAPHLAKRGPDHGNLPADVHPTMASKATDTDAPLILTEGIPKADALLTAALAEGVDIVPVALTGVTMGFEAHDADDGSLKKKYEITPSLARIVEGRETVYLCWDSDWAENKMVRGSLARTGQLLRKAGVDNVIFLGVPNDGGSDKTGVDDWLAGGGSLADLLTNHQMSEPDLDPDDTPDRIDAFDNVFQVDEESRQIWAYELKRKGSDPKPRMVQEVKLAATARIVDEISECRIVDHLLRPASETYTVRVEWFQDLPSGRVGHSRDIEVLATEFHDVRTWLSSLSATAKIRLAPGRNDQAIVANTILKRTEEAVAAGTAGVTGTVISNTTGWFFEPSDEGEFRSGWRYVHGFGWIGSPAEVVIGDFERHPHLPGIADLEPIVSDSAKVVSESEAKFSHPIVEGDLDDVTAEWKQWFNDWVLGGVVDRLVAEDPKRFTPRNDEEVRHLEDLKLRLALGAMIVARSLLPGTPAMGTPYLVGRASAGKTLLARVWTSCFGSRFGDRPYLSFSSTSAGVEVKLADARNMVALVDDFRPAAGNEMEAMNKVVDQIARGAYDGAVKSRSTRDLKAMEVPQISGSVVLTGEELPNMSSASNSTIQRLITLRIQHGSNPSYEMMQYLSRENTRPQQVACGFMIGVLARLLDEAVDPDESTPARKASKSAQKVTAYLTEWQDVLMETTTSRTRFTPTNRPTERTKTIIRDLLLGGSLLIEVGRGLGVLKTPADYDKAMDALTVAASWALTETAQTVANTAPANNVADGISQILRHGRGYLVSAQGGSPSDDSALTWGWLKRPDGPWEKAGDLIGFVVVVNGATVVALNPAVTAKALRQLSDDRDQSATRVSQALANATDEHGDPVLQQGFGSHDPRRKIAIGGQSQHFLLVRPEAIGVNVSSLAPEETPKAIPVDDTATAFDNLADLDMEEVAAVDDGLTDLLKDVEIT